MPWLKLQDGTVAHICTRGSRNPVKGCRVCGFVSTKICDYVYPGGRACNAPLCDQHAVSIAHNVDYCATHPGAFPQQTFSFDKEAR
jgi:hypothetical protein